ncbi:MAG: helix-turn-helix transcriptional regulator [Anaerolineae bacterium]|nr:helix-turn-helix transcriptional regulator [Anaerolineae bacterium]
MELVFDERLSDAPLVETVWRSHSERAGSFMSTAASQTEMVVTRYQGKTSFTVRGPETRATEANYPADTEFFGIIFRLGTFLPHLPTKMIMDRRDLTLPEASSGSFWLQGSAWQFPDFDNADTFVNRLVRTGVLAHDPVIDAVLDGSPYPLSARAVQYRFLQATGLTYNTIQQIERARRAITLLRRGWSILDTIAEAGYYDQPHLTRAMKRYAGETPAKIALLNTSP